MSISKRDIFHMSHQEQVAGKKVWKRSEQNGQLTSSSFNAESTAPKTWILYANPKGEEICTIECELMIVGRSSNTSEGVMMLLAMCPKCANHIHIREDNKALSIDMVPYRKAPTHLKINWRFHCANALCRPFSDNDLIPVVSSSEPWTCDYCKEWRVQVHGGVAKVDNSKSAATIFVHSRASGSGSSNIEF